MLSLFIFLIFMIQYLVKLSNRHDKKKMSFSNVPPFCIAKKLSGPLSKSDDCIGLQGVSEKTPFLGFIKSLILKHEVFWNIKKKTDMIYQLWIINKLNKSDISYIYHIAYSIKSQWTISLKWIIQDILERAFSETPCTTIVNLFHKKAET